MISNYTRHYIEKVNMKNLEASEQKGIVFILLHDAKYKYIRHLWHFNALDNINLTMPQAKRAKDLGRRRGRTDFMMLGLWIEKNWHVGKAMILRAGLFIEYKATGTQLRKKNSKEYLKNAHIQEQHEYIKGLNSAGCVASFAVSPSDFFRKLDHFLNNYELITKQESRK